MFVKFILLAVAFTIVSSIFNGRLAKRYQFPYVALVNSPRFYCAGTLISTSHVVSAAHCLMSVKQGKPINVSLGALEYYGKSLSDGILINSYKFWIHENFSMPSAVNDVGLIELPNPVVESAAIKFIGIETKPNADYDFKDNLVIVSGWGYSSPGTVSKQLRFTTMRLMPLNQCENFRSHYIESLTKNHICASKIENLPCDGDSGSSFVSLKTGKVLGVLSYVKDAENGRDLGYNDCKSNIPVVATRISSYVSWIQEKSGLIF